MGSPILPLAVAQPSCQSGAEKTQPDRTFPILTDSGDIVRGHALLGVDHLPASQLGGAPARDW